MDFCVGERQRTPPGTAEDKPPFDIEMIAEPLDVGDQVVGGIGGQIHVRRASVRGTPAAASLVVQHDAIALGIEEASMPGRAPRAGPTVKDERRFSLRIPADLPE